MFGIDTVGSTPTFPATQPAGTSGYFLAGNPLAGVPPTPVSADWANILTAEIQTCLAHASITQNKRDNTQLYQSIVQIATSIATALVAAAVSTAGLVPIGGIMMWSGSTVPSGWAICNGTLGTPNLIDRFIVGSGDLYTTGAMGGSAVGATSEAAAGADGTGSTAITTAQMPPHTHVYHTGTGEQTIASGFPANAQNPFSYQSLTTDSAGSGNGHTHTTSAHTHAIANWNQLPPYYALAFIMRVS